MKYLALLTVPAALVGGSASMAASSSAQVAEGALTGPNGMTLYTFDRDAQKRKVDVQRPLCGQLATAVC